MKRRAFLQFLGLAPATPLASLVPGETHAKLIEAAEAAEPADTVLMLVDEEFEGIKCTLSMGFAATSVYTLVDSNGTSKT